MGIEKREWQNEKNRWWDMIVYYPIHLLLWIFEHFDARTYGCFLSEVFPGADAVHSLSPNIIGGKITEPLGSFHAPPWGRGYCRAKHSPGAGTLRVNSPPCGAAHSCQQLGSWQAPLETSAAWLGVIVSGLPRTLSTEMEIHQGEAGRGKCLLGTTSVRRACSVFTSISCTPEALLLVWEYYPKHSHVSFGSRSLSLPEFGL